MRGVVGPGYMSQRNNWLAQCHLECAFSTLGNKPGGLLWHYFFERLVLKSFRIMTQLIPYGPSPQAQPFESIRLINMLVDATCYILGYLITSIISTRSRRPRLSLYACSTSTPNCLPSCMSVVWRAILKHGLLQVCLPK